MTRQEIALNTQQSPELARSLADEIVGSFAMNDSAEIVPLFGEEVEDLLARAEVNGWSARCLHSRQVELVEGMSPRARYTLELEVEDRPTLLRITEPDKTASPELGVPLTYIHLPGFTEMIDGGTAKDLHDDLAKLLPGGRIVSIATDGVSRYGTSLGWKEGLGRTFEEMAEARLEIAKLVADDDPVVLIGVSMGTPIIKKMVAQNIEAQKQNDPWAVNVVQIINHSHACVPGARIAQDMVLRFPAHFVADALRRSLKHPEKLVGCLAVAKSFGRSLPAMAGNLKQLSRGTSTTESLTAAEAYKTGFISGNRDPLAQLQMLTGLAVAAPSTEITIKHKMGHAACLDSQEASQDIVDMHQGMLFATGQSTPKASS